MKKKRKKAKNRSYYKFAIINSIMTIITCLSIGYANETLFAGNEVSYDNSTSGLSSTTVQGALDELVDVADLNDRVTALEANQKTLDDIYPVGSIFITTSLSSTTAVANALGGTWEVYGTGKTLLSSTGASGQTGGSNTVTLNTSNLPSHSHTYDKANANTEGTTLTTNQIPSHSHTYDKANSNTEGTTLNINQIPSHNHVQNMGTNNMVAGGGSHVNSTVVTGEYLASPTSAKTYQQITNNTGGGQAHNHQIKTTNTSTGSAGSGQAHNHQIKTTSTNSGSTGSGTSFSVQNEYITVYMYKRKS